MKQIYLLDAYALIYRAFFPFAQRPRLDSKGNNVSAIYGFINSFNDILTSFRPEYIAVVFDPPGGSFRNDFYPDYKANRSETPEAIRFGVPYIKQVIELMGVNIFEVSGYEADDVIGTLAYQAELEGHEVLMLTPDKDYSQLVTDKVSILAPMTGGGYEEIGVRDVCKRFGVQQPKQVIDILAIMGDSADNFPGIKGIGIAGAQKLIAQYGSLEAVLDAAMDIKGAIGDKVRNHSEMALISKRLATIALDAPIRFDLEQCRRGSVNISALKQLLSELELRSQLNRLSKQYATEEQSNSDLFAEQSISSSKENLEIQACTPISFDYTLVDLSKEDKFNTFLSKLTQAEQLYVHPLLYGEPQQSLYAISFMLDDTKEVYHLDCVDSVFFSPFSALRQIVEIIPKSATLIGHDLKALLLCLKRDIGLSPLVGMEDIMIAHYLLMPDINHQLHILASRYLQLDLMSFEQLISPQKASKVDFSIIENIREQTYLAQRVFALKHLHKHLITELDKRGQLDLFLKLEMPLMHILLEMELDGVRIDHSELERQGQAMEQKLVLLEQEIHLLAGKEFNVNSPRQVGEVLFEDLALDSKAKKTKTGGYTTGEEVLEKYRDKHPIVSKILDYRACRKLLSTYILALPKLSDAFGRIHTSFNQTVATTGRLSSSNPNIQNIPIRSEQGRAIRAAFLPNEGEIFVSADYSQIELRLMAHFSQDPSLIEAFRSGQDIHQATAARIAGIALDAVTPDMRRNAKTANFGIIYGVSAFGLAEQLGISRSEAKALIDGYFSSYPAVDRYMKDIVVQARSKGYVKTLVGRRRYLNDIDSNNAVLRGYAERNAINAPLQGTAADIIKQAMIYIAQEISKQGLKSKMLLQVHDELNFTVPKDELELMTALIRREMERAGEGLSVPLEVGIGVGQNWLEAH